MLLGLKDPFFHFDIQCVSRYHSTVEQLFNYFQRIMTTFLKIILPIYLVLFFGLAMFWRSYLAWKHTGVNPYALGNDDLVHDYVGKLFRITLVATVVIVLAFSFFETLYNFFLPISWRIGIDEKSSALLVQHGLFGISRNPIFLGMIVMLVGLFFTVPTAVTLMVTVLGIVLIQIQVRLEEAFLLQRYGKAYREYQSHVHRWI